MNIDGCPRCLQVFCNNLRATTRIQSGYLHYNPSELVDGVLRRCWWCLKIFQSFKMALNKENMPTDEFLATYPDFRTTAVPDYQMFWVQCSSASINTGYKSDPLWPYEDVGCVFNYFEVEDAHPAIPKPSLCGTTSSKESSAFVAHQIERCQREHSLCRTPLRRWYPTRLLKVLSDRDSVFLSVIETAEELLVGPYVTLSHCWGGKLPLRLLTQNREEYKTSLPASIIPRLYLDAVKVALDLSIKYLWIDSLCIIQDSREDWRQESALMGQVYQHGLFNIEAVSAKNCSESLFASRDPFLLFPHEMSETALETNMHLVWTESDDEYWASGRFVVEEPLYQRGWVFQERLLAKRSLTYTRKQIFYRCAEEHTSEIGGLSHFLEELRQGYTPLESLSTMTLTPENCFKKWMKILTNYNITALTMPSDKLVAISGVAQMFGQVRQSRYLAGLWEHTLLEDLLWTRIGNSGRPQTYRAPTWSWASVYSFEPPVYEPAQRCTACLTSVPKVIGASTQPIGSDKYGEVMDGRLQLKGHLYSLFQGQDMTLGQALNVEEEPGGLLESRIKTTLRYLFPEFEGSSLSINVHMDYDTTSSEDELVLRECFMMPLNNERGYGSHHQIDLLLLAATTPAWGLYQRIGVCKILGGSIHCPLERRFETPPDEAFRYYKDGARVIQQHDEKLCQSDGAMMLEFMSVMRSRGDEAPSHEYDASGRHTITII